MSGLDLFALEEPGPIREAAVAAAAATLRMQLSLCLDRARPIAALMLDQALAAAQRAA